MDTIFAQTTDFSGTLDIDSDDIAHIPEDIDTLDNILFSNSLKKQKSFPANNHESLNVQSVGDVKKRNVTFQDPNKDDPLADLLSDEDKPQDKGNTFLSFKNDVIESLFGTKTSDASVSHVTTDHKENDTGHAGTTKQSVIFQKGRRSSLKDETVWNRSGSSEQTDVYKGKSGAQDLSDRAKPMNDKSKKLSLMDDLFGNKTQPSIKPINFQESIANQESEALTSMQTEHSKTEQTSKSRNSGYAPTISGEPRRGKRPSEIIYDPLGLLSANTQLDQTSELVSQEKVIAVTRAEDKDNVKSMNLPEWLDGRKKSDASRLENLKEVPVSNVRSFAKPNESTDFDGIQRPAESARISLSEPGKHEHPYSEYMSILTGMQFDQQAAIMSMRQQEHELRTAATLSKQNEQLNQVLDMQKSQLREQDKQFNVLIQRQMERQVALEAQMKKHQERIAHYVQTLTAQPTTLSSLTDNTINVGDVENKNGAQSVNLLVQELQLERSHLESVIHSLTEKYQAEAMIQEESYKRQIIFLQETMDNLEKRIRRETESLILDYEAKIAKLREEQVQAEIIYKEKMEATKKEHEQFVNEIYAQHSRNISLLQKEYSELIDNISKAKELDNLARATVTTHEADMNSILRKADTILDTMKNVHERIDEREDNVTKARENYLKQQQQYLELQKQELERQTNALEKERDRIMQVAEQLVTQTADLTLELQEQSRQHIKAAEDFKKKEKCLIRDRELFEEKIKWERDYLQALKESWLREQERQMKALDEEKGTVSAERARLEVLTKLNIGTEDTAKTELRATLKAAQDAIAVANEERIKWQDRISKLEVQQQRVLERESQLMLRAKELENLTQAALAKREEGLRAFKEASTMERHYRERAAKLQQQLEVIAQGEKKMAMEKISLARERLELGMLHVQGRPEKDLETIVLNCNTYNPIYSPKLQQSTQVAARFTDIVDPHLVMLQLDTLAKYRDGVDTRALQENH